MKLYVNYLLKALPTQLITSHFCINAQPNSMVVRMLIHFVDSSRKSCAFNGIFLCLKHFKSLCVPFIPNVLILRSFVSHSFFVSLLLQFKSMLKCSFIKIALHQQQIALENFLYYFRKVWLLCVIISGNLFLKSKADSIRDFHKYGNRAFFEAVTDLCMRKTC